MCLPPVVLKARFCLFVCLVGVLARAGTGMGYPYNVDWGMAADIDEPFQAFGG